MNTQYRKNLKAVMQVNKNYTDTEIKKSEERMKWYIGEYQTTTQDDNTTAYQKTVPSGATRVKIKRIYGNTLKYNPSVASDSTVAFMKTLPDIVYTLDVSYVYGASEVSENLLVLNDVAETTTRGITYSVVKGVIKFNGTYTGTSGYIRISLKSNIILSTNNSYYVIDINNNGFYMSTVSSGNIDVLANGGNTITNSNAEIYDIKVWFINGETYNLTFKPMLVKGTTAPTEFKVGFDGIHNLELTGIKSEGRNLANLGNVAQTTTTGVTYKCENGAVTMGANATGNTRVFIPLETPLPAGTYTYNQFTKLNGHNAYLSDDNNATNIQLLLSSGTTNPTATITTDRTMNYLYYYTPNGSQYNSYTFTPMIVRGEIVPTEYQPYVTPTTKTIDLTSIEDSGGNKLFADGSLKGVGNVVDEITPYKAIKRIDEVLGSTYENVITTATTSAGLTCVVIQTNITFVDSDTTPLVEINNLGLTTLSASSQWTTTLKNVIAFNRSKRIIITFDQELTEQQMIDKAKTLMVNFALLTPIEVSIDWSATLRNIQGYSKGTITLQNTYNMDTANTITYNSMIKENCCSKIVQTRGGNVVKTINLPTQASDGYSAGSASNVRDFTTNKRIGNVDKKSNMATYEWSYTSGDYPRFYTQQLEDINTSSGNYLCDKYTYVSEGTITGDNIDMTFTVRSNGRVMCKNLSYTDTITFTAFMTNVPLYYELTDASKTETDITAIENVIEVEPNDVLSFYNSDDELVTIPSDLTYRIEVARV